MPRSAKTSGCRSRRRRSRRWPARRCSSTCRPRTSRSARPTTGTSWSRSSRRAARRPTCTHRPASANRRPTWPGTARRSSTKAASCSRNRSDSSTARICSPPTSTSSGSRGSGCARTPSASRWRDTRQCSPASGPSRSSCRSTSCPSPRCAAVSTVFHTCPPMRRPATSAVPRSTASRSRLSCSASRPPASTRSCSASRAASIRPRRCWSAPGRWSCSACRTRTSSPTPCPASRRARARSTRPGG